VAELTAKMNCTTLPVCAWKHLPTGLVQQRFWQLWKTCAKTCNNQVHFAWLKRLRGNTQLNA